MLRGFGYRIGSRLRNRKTAKSLSRYYVGDRAPESQEGKAIDRADA